MRRFVWQGIKGWRVCALNQYYKSKNCDDILKIISEELNVRGNIYDFIEAYLKFKYKKLKIYEKDYEIKFNDYTDEDVDGKEKSINKNLI